MISLNLENKMIEIIEIVFTKFCHVVAFLKEKNHEKDFSWKFIILLF